MTTEAERAWLAVPERSVVAMRRAGRAFMLAYRDDHSHGKFVCEDTGTWDVYRDEYKRLRGIWPWTFDSETDFVILVSGINPLISDADLALLCNKRTERL